MDLGIRGRWALVCASSKGLGLGCARALAADGVNLVLVARSAEALEKTAEEIRRAHGVTVTAAIPLSPELQMLQPGFDRRSATDRRARARVN